MGITYTYSQTYSATMHRDDTTTYEQLLSRIPNTTYATHTVNGKVTG